MDDKKLRLKKDIDLSRNFKDELSAELTDKTTEDNKKDQSEMAFKIIENCNPDDFE
ncbi:MAG: hypothetical protein GX198_01380 [Epulopiscium sp.]|nr:hypothetical protein [Candidatus Epulonipiscium sp.]HOQ15865.1 hypothetical protein [Defluviitaleaceae bacterium]HPT76317.1 hypothetical protein [Defluviitaleaceae bacterium]